MRLRCIRLSLTVVLLGAAVTTSVLAQDEPRPDALAGDAMLSSPPVYTSPKAHPPLHPMPLVIGRPVSRSGRFALGLQRAPDERGVDTHEINTAFAARSQDPNGLAGARLSFHF